MALAALLAFSGLGCSGGDGGGGTTPPTGSLAITVTGTTQPSPGVVCTTFEVRGADPNALVNILAEYVRISNATVQIPATPISSALATQLGLDITQGTAGEVTVNANGEFLTGVFYWWAGQDLGFIQDSIQVCLTPSNPMTPATAGTTGCSTFFVYDAGQASSSSSGAGAGSGAAGQPSGGTGRAGHTAHAVRATGAASSEKNIVVSGGYNDSSVPNAFDSSDRFRFGTTNGTPNGSHTLPFGGLMSDRRVLHASAWFVDPTSGGTRVLVCGGVDSSGVEALTPGVPNLAARVGGGTETASADIYTLSPESVGPTATPMISARFAHTATWVPHCNAIVVIGGANFPGTPVTGGTIQGLTSIERYDPAAQTWTASMATLNAPRVEHTATMIQGGRILIYGGYDPANPTQALDPEVYDPEADDITLISGAALPAAAALFGRSGHTATRLFDGRVLIAGGRDLNGALLNTAQLLTPTNIAIAPSSFQFTNLTMSQARARHAATVLGTGLVLLTGGVSLDSGMSAEFTNASEIFNPSLVLGPVPFTNPFSPVNFMLEPRAEHSLTATDCGSVFVIGGRNQSMGGAPTFLDSIEFYAFSNSIPVVNSPMTASVNSASMIGIDFTVTDSEQDGGYVIVRFREAGTTKWLNAYIDTQINPGGGAQTPASGRVIAGNYQFIWNYNANGVSSGTLVDIQLIPVGANIGTAVQFQARIP